MSFHESWLIPKERFLDYLDFVKKGREEAENTQCDFSDHQEGGGVGAVLKSHLNPPSRQLPSRALKRARIYMSNDRIRSGDMLPVPLSTKPHFTDPASEQYRLNISDITAWFPEGEKFKVMSLLNYINQYLLNRFAIDRYLNISIDRKYMWNTNIVDILKYLFSIERFYVTQHKIVQDPVTRAKYGIPLGTEEFVAMLRTRHHFLRAFGISPHRLKLLETGILSGEDSDDDDQHDNGRGSSGGGGGRRDDDNDDDRGGGGGRGGGDRTPFQRKRGLSAMKRKLSFTNAARKAFGKTPPTIVEELEDDDVQPSTSSSHVQQQPTTPLPPVPPTPFFTPRSSSSPPFNSSTPQQQFFTPGIGLLTKSNSLSSIDSTGSGTTTSPPAATLPPPTQSLSTTATTTAPSTASSPNSPPPNVVASGGAGADAAAAPLPTLNDLVENNLSQFLQNLSASHTPVTTSPDTTVPQTTTPQDMYSPLWKKTRKYKREHQQEQQQQQSPSEIKVPKSKNGKGVKGKAGKKAKKS